MRPITASDLMNPLVLAVPGEMPIRGLASFLIENEITGAPVQDTLGRLVGVVSMVDIAAVLARESGEEEPQTVAEIMSPGVVTVREEATVSEIASLMLSRHLHRVVVLRGDEAVGVISTTDLLGLLLEEHQN
ncbi:MAG TPA: CBS domain-containing protein [Thermoanaerobaculia bacterium]|nr:CBS domain-containing protein [Thermoanaerobaculia bacterium]